MNIQISDSWLREFIDTPATPEQIREYLSLCSQSVEKLIKDGQETIYDIEITTNRPDCLSVYGIARELAAVLPRFGIKAHLTDVPVAEMPTITEGLPLQIKISKADLCPRFTALIYDNIKIKPAPKYAQERLKLAGIRALNNVIDISNYLMLELGQPMHTFDYDKILKHKMFLREAKAGEAIITLDDQKRSLTDGVIIIEDGEKRIVDLCGIMGAKNSETDENTKRVLLFVQTYNPAKIRKTTQLLGFRTEAASRFEKGMDPEGVIPTMARATLLFKDWCEANPASELFDIYPKKIEEKTVKVSLEKLTNLTGIEIKLDEAKEILENLGFKVTTETEDQTIIATVPHWRNGDVAIPEDLVEEVARIYGYHNLPNVLPPLTSVPPQRDNTFDWENKIKNALKYWGYIEVANYSMVGKALLDKVELDPNFCLKIANPLTDDLTYLRNSLIPSLLEVVAKNSSDQISVFEMASEFFPTKESSLPNETTELTVVNDISYLHLKGTLELLLNDLGITEYEFKPVSDFDHAILNALGGIYIQKTQIGIIGKIKNNLKSSFGIKKDVFVLDIELGRLLKFATKNRKYSPISRYPPVIEDLSFLFPSKTYIGPVIEEVKKISEIIKSVELLDSYQNTRTFRITYQSNEKNLNDKEVGQVRKEIIAKIENKFAAELKEKL